ncbi:hypothetical protein [Endozoicomonas sp.]|uniref:hypothetical protein n=1 Tax=Endozoicomonas sp. TaxID=1892382 RepID=UPI002887BEEF|nr:hypothetical protein [Endozoicomonas sp.]
MARIKTGGRVVGSANKLSAVVRDTLKDALCHDFSKIQVYLSEIDDPKDKLELLIKFLPYICSKVSEKPEEEAPSQTVIFNQHIIKPDKDTETDGIDPADTDNSLRLVTDNS